MCFSYNDHKNDVASLHLLENSLLSEDIFTSTGLCF